MRTKLIPLGLLASLSMCAAGCGNVHQGPSSSLVRIMALEAASIKIVHEYDYANLWFMFGSSPDWVPYSVGLGWASMVYVGMQTSDRVGLPWWQRPFLDGAVATVLDLVLDTMNVAYNGTTFLTKPWSAGSNNDFLGVPNIACLDLFSNGGSPVYWDDILLDWNIVATAETSWSELKSLY